MTTKHTPGPWIYSQGSVYMSTPLDADGFPTSCIAHMDRENPDTFGAERDANARLIAAAPRLLEALEKLEQAARTNSSWQSVEDACDEAEAAIAEAKGEDA